MNNNGVSKQTIWLLALSLGLALVIIAFLLVQVLR